VTVGSYSKATRRQKIERFKAKKLRTLQYGPYVRYQFRKEFAGTRPRVGGRFIKLEPPPAEASTAEIEPPLLLAAEKSSDATQDWLDALFLNEEVPSFRPESPEFISVVG